MLETQDGQWWGGEKLGVCKRKDGTQDKRAGGKIEALGRNSSEGKKKERK